MAAMTLDGFTQALRDAHGDALRAVVLYGSAARGEQVAKHSDHNVLVLVRALTPASLRASARATREWRALGNPPPLILTEAEWHASRDVFAIEVADILAHHRELWGTLPHGAPVEAANLRHQLEFEAMGKLLALRQGLLPPTGTPPRRSRCSRPRGARCWCSSGRCCACTANRPPTARLRWCGARPVTPGSTPHPS